ncbi:MAG: DUF4832 domain-containing protein [Treponema sp.]|nr:DUF4832 domain-containing protein [Treponema sp.]
MCKHTPLLLLCSLVFLGCDNPLKKVEDLSKENEARNRSVQKLSVSAQESERDENGINKVKQGLTYGDANEIIYNPDMGFYSTIDIRVEPDGMDFDHKKTVLRQISSATEKYKDSYNSDAKFDLIHLQFDLSAFSDNAKRDIILTKVTDDKGYSKNVGKPITGKTQQLTSAAIADIEEILAAVEAANKTSIVRFSYDYKYQGQKKYADEHGKITKDNFVVESYSNGAPVYKLYKNARGETEYSDVEPDAKDFETVVLGHIGQLTSVLDANKKSITAIECGFIGPYGEMHSTTLSGKYNGVTNGFIIEVMHKFLTCLGTDIPLLVSQPKYIKLYCQQYGNNLDASRLGLYNCGYLASVSDSGTFENRAEDVAYLKPFTAKTPYGGTICYDDGKQKALWHAEKLEKSIKEMHDVHLSFLNISENSYVLEWADSNTIPYKKDSVTISDSNKYSNEKFFQYLIKHMGYRYYLTGSCFEYADDVSTIKMNLDFKNNGFANIPYHRQKYMTIIFAKGDIAAVSYQVENQLFDGTKKEFELDTKSLPSGKYNVYLRISDSDGKYPIRLANPSDMWKPIFNATKIGIVTKQ